MEKNNEKLVGVVQNLFKLSNERRRNEITGRELDVDLLPKMQKKPLALYAANSSKGGSLEQVVFGKTSAVNISKHVRELPEVEKLPKSCTWVFVDRNQRMTEEHTIANQKRIYYDKDSGEALYCSDSEDGKTKEEEKKKGFAELEDYTLRKTVQEFSLSDTVVNSLAHSFSRNPGDVQGRCDYLMKGGNSLDGGIVVGTVASLFDKDLDAALDSFDSLFCRRCLVFDCKLHGCPKELIFSAEKQTSWCSPDAEKDPCGPNCHILVTRSSSQNERSLYIEESTCAASESSSGFFSDCMGKGPGGKLKSSKKRKEHGADNVQHQTSNVGTCNGSWTSLEKSFFEKGLQIFGKKSCLIARNTMNGLKTCYETFMYMNSFGNEETGDGRNADVSAGNKGDDNEPTRGKKGQLKYKPKCSGYPLLNKRIDTVDGLKPHYNPCGCQSPCVKECGCAINGNTCEKYCGCPKSCKNRFRGCNCSKSQCRSRHCPCFAAHRECDPDVCKNCWISCGDGTIEVPTHKDENHECRNMNILTRQQKKILIARSDVDGWGAFLKRDVSKDEYIGEYTGEVITHIEAEKRGKLYDRAGLSYLFDLNEQVVIDSFHKGNKLKYANHSAKPNCLAKVMMVSGDHRVGIYAKEPIKAGQELFYDYHYSPKTQIQWALGSSSTSTSKKKDGGGPRSKSARKQA